jgi:hypothetical protein
MYSLYKNEYRIFKPDETTIRKGLRQNEENRKDKTIWVITHMYMEMSQGNPCVAILTNKNVIFSFLQS